MSEDLGYDYIPELLLGVADKALDTGAEVVSTAKGVVKTAAGVAKGIWNAPRAVGLKPVPTLMAGGAGLWLANAAGGTGAAAATGTTAASVSAASVGAVSVGAAPLAAGAVAVGAVYAVAALAKRYGNAAGDLGKIPRDPRPKLRVFNGRGAADVARALTRRARRAKVRARKSSQLTSGTSGPTSGTRTQRAQRRRMNAGLGRRRPVALKATGGMRTPGRRPGGLRRIVAMPSKAARRLLGFGRDLEMGR